MNFIKNVINLILCFGMAFSIYQSYKYIYRAAKEIFKMINERKG